MSTPHTTPITCFITIHIDITLHYFYFYLVLYFNLLHLSYSSLPTPFISLTWIIYHFFISYTSHLSVYHSRHTHHLTNNFIYRYKPIILLFLFCMDLNPHFRHLLANLNHDHAMIIHRHVTTTLTLVSCNICIITTRDNISFDTPCMFSTVHWQSKYISLPLLTLVLVRSPITPPYCHPITGYISHVNLIYH